MKKKSTRKQVVDDGEFESLVEKTDLGKLVKEPVIVQGRRGRKAIGERVSVVLPKLLLEEVKIAADKKAVGYQTMLRIIVAENVKRYTA